MAIKKPNLSNIYSTQADAANRDNKIAEDQLLPEYWENIEYKDMGDGTYLLYKEGENGEEIGMGWTNDEGFEVPAVESVSEIVSALNKAKTDYTDLRDTGQMTEEQLAGKINEINAKLEKISDYTDLRDTGQMTDEQLAEKVKEIYNSKSISAMDALKDVASSGANLAVEGANVGHEAASQANNNLMSKIEAGLEDLVTQISHYQDVAKQAQQDGLANPLNSMKIDSYNNSNNTQEAQWLEQVDKSVKDVISSIKNNATAEKSNEIRKELGEVLSAGVILGKEARNVGNHSIIDEVNARLKDFFIQWEDAKTSYESKVVNEEQQWRNNVVDRAYKAIGTPYAWGACSENAYDCSGLVAYVLTGNHERLGNTLTFWNWPETDNPQPGDVAVIDDGAGHGHTGIYIGDGQMIHAADYGIGVIVGPVQDGMKYVVYPG